MKFNQWTLGLAALGLVSLTSAAHADEKASTLGTALSSTVLSGYVDTSAQWNLGTGNSHAPGYTFGGPTKADGFNLNVVDLNLEKDADAADGWGAGYRVELWLGPDANLLGSQSSGLAGPGDLAVKNAYVDLKAPVGNGLDFKIGVYDTIIGYEVADSINNPNFTRSWGFTLEPTTHTGILATYMINEMLSVSGGIANTFGAPINQRAPGATGVNESYKTYMASVTFTAPTNWGWVSGSTLSGGIITGFNSGSPSAGGFGAHQTSIYAGSSINTPIKELKVGWAYDYVGNNPIVGTGDYANAGGLYATYQATEKLGLSGRVEYASFSKISAERLNNAGVAVASKMLGVTATAQYDLWKNVLTRVEFRWDHALDGSEAFGGSSFNDEVGSGTLKNSFELIANVAYKF